MNKWLNIPLKERIDIINSVGFSKGIRVEAIEKDWWVTMTLHALFSSKYKEYLHFKGGTSLSKGWNLIHRFSEDIDLGLDRGFLKYDGNLNGSQITRMRKDSCEFISEKLVKELMQQIQLMNVENFEIKAQETSESDKDPHIIEILYESMFENSDYIKPRVLVEVSCRSLDELIDSIEIQSIINQSGTYDFGTISIPTALPKRTFLEKIFLLHEEFLKEPNKIRSDKMSRHLYDLDSLMDSEYCEDVLTDPSLYYRIIKHRKIFFRIDDSQHNPETINFIPPNAIIDKWKEDYNQMKESMIYENEPKEFDKIIERMEELKQRIRKLR